MGTCGLQLVACGPISCVKQDTSSKAGPPAVHPINHAFLQSQVAHFAGLMLAVLVAQLLYGDVVG